MDLLMAENEILSLRGDLRGECLECRVGTVWLTQSGDGRDHFLRPGRPFVIRNKGHIVLTARSKVQLGFSDNIGLTVKTDK